MSDVTATGTGFFENNCYWNATFSGGSSVTLNYLGGTTGIEEYDMEQPVNDNRIYTLDGRCLGTTLPEGFRGVYIQNGKKHVKIQ